VPVIQAQKAHLKINPTYVEQEQLLKPQPPALRKVPPVLCF